MTKAAPIKERLIANSKRNPLTGCLEWQLGLHQDGYGRLDIKQESKKVTRRAHRLAYETFVGSIPEGLLVLHRCNNRKCIEATHLKVGTQKENIEQCVREGRGANKKGENQPRSKLTEIQVLKIRKLRNENCSLAQLSELFNVSRPTISMICLRRIWTHI